MSPSVLTFQYENCFLIELKGLIIGKDPVDVNRKHPYCKPHDKPHHSVVAVRSGPESGHQTLIRHQSVLAHPGSVEPYQVSEVGLGPSASPEAGGQLVVRGRAGPVAALLVVITGCPPSLWLRTAAKARRSKVKLGEARLPPANTGIHPMDLPRYQAALSALVSRQLIGNLNFKLEYPRASLQVVFVNQPGGVSQLLARPAERAEPVALCEMTPDWVGNPPRGGVHRYSIARGSGTERSDPYKGSYRPVAR